MASSKTSEMKKIRDEVWNLSRSPLFEYRTSHNYYPVLGEGSHDASIVFVGEAPGKNEAECGRPFCGAAGRVLDELLGSLSLSRDEVYITNIVKDRPPNNRDPLPSEIALYSPFLFRQIDVIQPKVIATLGRFSMKFVLEKFNAFEQNATISQLHGKEIEVKTSYGKTVVVPLFHPAVALYNASSKQSLLDDFQVLKKFLKKT